MTGNASTAAGRNATGHQANIIPGGTSANIAPSGNLSYLVLDLSCAAAIFLLVALACWSVRRQRQRKRMQLLSEVDSGAGANRLDSGKTTSSVELHGQTRAL